MGATSVSVRRQTCVYDRLVSAPIKIVMECVSKQFPELRNNFRPSWKDGNLWSTDGQLLGIWRIDVQQAKVRIHLQERFVQGAREGMDGGLARLQFGAYDEETYAARSSSDGKGKTKGKGKGKPSGRHLQPVERGCFKNAPPECRTALGSLVLSEYPFTVSVRSLKEEHYIEVGVEQPVRAPKKRTNEEEHDMQRPKRTPTPERASGSYAGAMGPVQDPWAQAQQQRQAAPAPGLPSMPSQPSQMGPEAAASAELAFGSRISA